MHHDHAASAFVARWRGVSGSERANCQLFVTELCRLLGVDEPGPASDDTRDNAYVFERRVVFAHGDGSSSHGYIDCYRRGAFVLEAKKIRAGAHTRGFDDALLRARAQAEAYARALPAAEGRPPFVVVVDVGHVIELYAEFTRSGATYTPYPDSRSHRIALADLADAAVRERLRRLWADPLSLDPARVSAKVTREVAVQLAAVARSLEAAGHAPPAVAAFLTRCLFSMFAEDVELLPRGPGGDGAFVHLLETHGDDPATLQQMLRILWADMDRGGFSAALAKDLLRFNGKLFKGAAEGGYVLPLDRGQIEGLLAAGRANWREVEPAIFGTLLERALDPAERHALGAHYTPRAYVERLVLPTVVEPLRADWADAQAAALLLAHEAAALPAGRERDRKMAEARAEVRRFHHRLCTVRVLDPACGSGNFLYVTLEHLKRLEGEVLEALHALGEGQARLGLEGETVTLQQLRGIEINERAAALAELVLWIGFLQWHLRTFGSAAVAEPVIHDYGNIEHRDAVLACDGQEPMRDAAGRLVTRWDGTSLRPHPATGEPVPDEAAQVPQWRYLNPRPAPWPQADFIVGNPPYVAAKDLRSELGEGYADALRSTWPEVPESADFVLYWWHAAASRVRDGLARRAGLITTNSVRQVLGRRVLARFLNDPVSPVRLSFAIPDHPWVDASDGADVRVALTVLERGVGDGRLCSVVSELAGSEGEVDVELRETVGVIQGDLRVGSAVGSATPLRANLGIANRGVQLLAPGFVVDAADVARLHGAQDLAKPIHNGKDLTSRPRGAFALDTFGIGEEELRVRYPTIYQWLAERAKPTRLLNPRESYRSEWWLFGENQPAMRKAVAGLKRYIVTTITAKHRTFQFLAEGHLADQALLTIATSDALTLGMLSSDAHVHWALAAGGRLGVGNDPRYSRTRCFETFPFPSDDTGLTPALAERIRALAEQIDAHRKARQAAHADVTLTGLYNVLARLRRDEPLSAKEKTLHAHGLVAVLRSLHDELDAAVLAAYGWSDLQPALADHRPGAAEARAAAVETLLERLVALNARRAAEEAAGTVRWLRPEFQCRAGADAPGTGPDDAQAVIELDEAPAPAAPLPPALQRPWPASLPEQIKAVAEVLAAAPGALSLADIESRFRARGRWRERLPVIVDTLAALGRARAHGEGRWRAA